MTVLEQLPQGARVAIIRLRSLGDCVLTTPAIDLLKRARPDLSVGMVVEPRFRDILEGNPHIDAILEPEWLPLRRWKPKLCLNLHGGTRSQLLTAGSGARWRAGFAHHSTTLAYNVRIPRAQAIMGVNRVVHTAEHLASAFFSLGVPLCPVPRAQLFAGQSAYSGRYAVLHAFASAPDKQWPAARFAEVARYLKLCDIRPIFLAAPGEDTTPFAGHDVLTCTLGPAKALLSKAVLFIGNDSGPAHIAAAFQVPSLVLFSSRISPAVWEPWQTESEVILAREAMAEVSVSRVIAAIERLRAVTEAHA
jgi:ADP-heptose:LPS heptosyltransferase